MATEYDQWHVTVQGFSRARAAAFDARSPTAAIREINEGIEEWADHALAHSAEDIEAPPLPKVLDVIFDELQERWDGG